MNIEKSNTIGEIQYSLEAIAELAGNTVISVYGVVGLVDRKKFRKSLMVVLRKEDFSDGVIVKKVKDEYIVSLYVVLSKDVRITEVVLEIQKQLSYVLQKTFGIPFKTIDVYVYGVK